MIACCQFVDLILVNVISQDMEVLQIYCSTQFHIDFADCNDRLCCQVEHE